MRSGLTTRTPSATAWKLTTAGTDVLPAEPFQCEDVGDVRGGRVLHHVAGFGDRDRNFGYAGVPDGIDVASAEDMALAQPLAVRKLQRMGKCRAGEIAGVVKRPDAEPHGLDDSHLRRDLPLSEGLDHLRENRDCDFRGARRADIEADRRRDRVDRLLRHAIRQQTLDTLRMGLAAAERADIEALRLQRRLQRIVVDLRIVRDRAQRAIGVERGAVSARLPAIPRRGERPRNAPAWRRQCADR